MDIGNINNSQGIEKVKLSYDRNLGFKAEPSLDRLATRRAKDFILAYTSSIEKDPKFRDVTNKMVLKIFYIVAIAIFVTLLIISNIISAILCPLVIVALIHGVGYLQTTRLLKLREEYNLKLAGTDWAHFNCHITNIFGLKESKWYYIMLPFITPDIELIVKYENSSMRIATASNLNDPLVDVHEENAIMREVSRRNSRVIRSQENFEVNGIDVSHPKGDFREEQEEYVGRGVRPLSNVDMKKRQIVLSPKIKEKICQKSPQPVQRPT